MLYKVRAFNMGYTYASSRVFKEKGPLSFMWIICHIMCLNKTGPSIWIICYIKGIQFSNSSVPYVNYMPHQVFK